MADKGPTVTRALRKLPVPLAAEVKAEIAHELIKLMLLKRDAENALADHSRRQRELIKGMDAKLEDFADQHDAGTSQNDVEVEIVEDFGRNVVRVTRLDTLEIVEERAITAEERQLLLALPQNSAEPAQPAFRDCPVCGKLEFARRLADGGHVCDAPAREETNADLEGAPAVTDQPVVSRGPVPSAVAELELDRDLARKPEEKPATKNGKRGKRKPAEA